MKTKRILSAIALTIATVFAQSFAQTIYYQTETTYDLGNGVTYRADIRHGGHVYLYNANNIYTYADITYADGSALPVEIADADVPSYSMTAASDRDIQARVNGALTTAQKQIVGDRRLPMSVIVSAQTGKVIEVFFGFSKNSPYNQLPPSVFRQIEQNFMTRPQIDGFALTAVGRQLNYVMFSWAHKFSIVVPTIDIDVDGLRIGEVYNRQQVASKFGQPSDYWSEMSADGLNEEYHYLYDEYTYPHYYLQYPVTVEGDFDNILYFKNGGRFDSFVIETSHFPVWSTYDGGIRIGDSEMKLREWCNLHGFMMDSESVNWENGVYFIRRHEQHDALRVEWSYNDLVITSISFTLSE